MIFTATQGPTGLISKSEIAADNLPHVKELLGHKNVNSTFIYIHLVNFENPDQFHSATAKSIEEAKKLVEAGFQYVCTYNDTMLFRKPK